MSDKFTYQLTNEFKNKQELQDAINQLKEYKEPYKVKPIGGKVAVFTMGRNRMTDKESCKSANMIRIDTTPIIMKIMKQAKKVAY